MVDAEIIEPTPEDVLRGFWTEMYQWELEAYRTMPSPSQAPPEASMRHYAQAGVTMQAIFDRYCTPKKRPYTGGVYRSISSPPEYDPQKTTILEVTYESPRRVVIKTEGDGHLTHGITLFVLLRRGDRWWIDSRKLVGADGKTHAMPL